MADLHIDMDGLARTRDSLDRVERLLREPVDTMASRASAATEIDVLRSRLSDPRRRSGGGAGDRHQP